MLTLACAMIGACGGRTLKTRDEPPTDSVDAGPRGVPVDPLPAIPSPVDIAHGSDSVASLRTPLPSEAVSNVVYTLFEAFHERSTDRLNDLFDATVTDLISDQARPRYLWLSDLGTRMKNAPFDQLDLEQMYRSQDVEIYAREELDQPGRPPRPSWMAIDDVLVRIPIATTRLGADYLFGDEIKLLLRREGTHYLVRGYGESVPK